ncbi:MAG: ABC transporter substrate-binding protein [Pseudomonadota bacterium]
MSRIPHAKATRQPGTRRTLIKAAAVAAVAPVLAGAPFVNVLAQAPRAKIRIGVVPLISSGPLFIAQARGFWDRMNIEAEYRYFTDGALAVPALVAGELDFTVATCNAGIFNTIARGAPFKFMLDRGSERPGSGSMTIVVNNKLHAAGLTTPERMSMLKGQRLGLQAPGGIDQFLLGRGVQNAALNPLTDVNWVTGLAYPDLVRALGAGQVDAANIPVPLAFLAEKNNTGKIAFPGSDIQPGTQLACFAAPAKLLGKDRSLAVRFAMVHLHAARIFNEAAAAKDPSVIKIISDATKVPEGLVSAAAPRWTWFTENGMPNVDSAMFQADFWRDTMKLFSGKITREQVFELGAAQEAFNRLKEKNPLTA